MKIDLRFWITLAFIPLLLAVLFAIVFVSLDFVELTVSFFLELACVTGISVIVKLWFYPAGEDKALKNKEITDLKKDYFNYVDTNIKDSKSLDEFLVVLNKKNREDYVKNKMGKRTPETMQRENVKTWWFKLFHRKTVKDCTDEQIAQIRYDYLVTKYTYKADKLPVIYSQDIMELTPSATLADSKNYRRKHKIQYQTLTTIGSVLFLTALSMIAWDCIQGNWESVFRYVTYVFTIFSTSATTYFTALRTADVDERSHVQRCRDIVRKYKSFMLEGGTNGINKISTVANVERSVSDNGRLPIPVERNNELVHGNIAVDTNNSGL